jgi:hypothetical protein
MIDFVIPKREERQQLGHNRQELPQIRFETYRIDSGAGEVRKPCWP